MTTLIVTEKPKVAERIANALGGAKKETRNRIGYYVAGDKNLIVAPAVGHIYGLKERKKGYGFSKYPVFEIEWAPSYSIAKSSSFTKSYLENLKFLAKKCDAFINACDYDIEGSVIGFNAIKHACNADPFSGNVKRMKFSTLTGKSIVDAYNNLVPVDKGMVDAGLTRHTLDWYWGINLSRALNSATRKARRFVTLSIGRVQGPTLNMLAKREKEIKAFVPEPYWVIEMIVDIKGDAISSYHEKDKFRDKKEVEEIRGRCGNTAVVKDIKKKKNIIKPPHPFDLTTLQTEAYKTLGMHPRKTLEIAQDLYTSGVISYPRTSSQQLPDEINFIEILEKLSMIEDYSRLYTILKNKIKEGKLKPNNGKKKDPAHPAIHPTGEKPDWLEIKATQYHKKIYDLVTKRFFATFGDNAVRESVTLKLDNNNEIFVANGVKTVENGWFELYGKYAKFDDIALPITNKGDILEVKSIEIHEKETSPPKRYTPASIIRLMEKNNLGTKATRSQIIDVLFERNYLTGKSIEVTCLGLDVVETLNKYCPEVLSVELTRKFEEEIEKIRSKKLDAEVVVKEGEETLIHISEEFKENEHSIGEALANSIDETIRLQSHLGKCLQCGGNLVLKSVSKHGKYGRFTSNFAGCDNYPKCRFTFSLPSGLLKREGADVCSECGSPIFTRIVRGKRPWKFCVNPECSTRKDK
ncbi:MAG: DNA topoisomerase I [Candidatus Altiarchaeales archaeon WOR_SM1_86-2]|nr:MAG: DNA topoisomerase I [Candidatus Altiarchaeales archaeon WOR_SM1_86-2]